jgi:hypothetical protein
MPIISVLVTHVISLHALAERKAGGCVSVCPIRIEQPHRSNREHLLQRTVN